MRNAIAILVIVAACGGDGDPDKDTIAIIGVEKATSASRWAYDLLVRLPCTEAVATNCSAPKSKGAPNHFLAPNDPRSSLEVEDGELWIEVYSPAPRGREVRYSQSVVRIPLDVSSGRHRVRLFWRHPLDSFTAPYRQVEPFYVDVP